MEKRKQKHSSSSISIFPEEEDEDLYFDEVNEEELLSLHNDINLKLFQDKYEEVPTNTVNPIAYGIFSFSQLRGGGGGCFGPHPRKQS